MTEFDPARAELLRVLLRQRKPAMAWGDLDRPLLVMQPGRVDGFWSVGGCVHELVAWCEEYQVERRWSP